MTYRINHLNKKTGITYVYESISYWDKVKKQPRTKQVCIGKLDKDSGEFIPSKRLNSEQAAARDPQVTAKAQIIGPNIILDTITQELKLGECCKRNLSGKRSAKIVLLVYYLCGTKDVANRNN